MLEKFNSVERREIEWGVYPFSVIVALGVTKNELLRFTRKFLAPLDIQYIESQRFDSGKTVFSINDLTILWLEKYPEIGSPILAHEIFHAVTFLIVVYFLIQIPIKKQDRKRKFEK